MPMPENPGTAPQFGTEQPASIPMPEPVSDAPKRRSTVREAPPAMRFDDAPAAAPASSVYERSESPPLASANGEQEPAPAPENAPPAKKGWWRR
jgi:hypothetical protein